MLKLDLHLHSCFSDDAIGTPEDLVQSLQKRGLQGMALTDHNTIKGCLRAQKVAPKDFLVIPSLEISTADGHMLAVNVAETIPGCRSVEETVDRIIDAGGEPIVPHLFRLLSGIKKEKLKAIQTKISAIEVFNGCSVPDSNLKTAKIARAFNLGGTGGSDSHDPAYAGYAYTVVDTTDLRIDTVLSEIHKKKTWGEGLTMPLAYRRDRMVLSIRQFVQRGFRRI
ncbi:MAG TPA: PHP domain-containing protein [Candidatus Thermoplasmatota archaeon]|nr:PHP domain-containing protein [Candidatus Thermoplasmatota archaeon]